MPNLQLDDILAILQDNKWHDIYEVGFRQDMSYSTYLKCIDFLIDYLIIQVRRNKEGKMTHIKLSKGVAKWYANTKEGGE